MGFLRRTKKARKGEGSVVGLLAQAMIYRRSMETAGLLSKAADEGEKTVGTGLLGKADRTEKAEEQFESYAGEEGPQAHGLLARAVQFHEGGVVRGGFREEVSAEGFQDQTAPTGIHVVSEHEQPALSENGLLAKALRYRMGLSGTEGLLQKAEAVFQGYEEPVGTAASDTGEEVSELSYEPVEKGPDFIEEEKLPLEEIVEEMQVLEEAPEEIELEEVPVFEEISEEAPGEEVHEETPGLKETVEALAGGEEEETGLEEVSEEPSAGVGEMVPEARQPLSEAGKEPEDHEKPPIIRYTAEHDALQLTGLLSRIVAEEGYEALMQQVLEAAVHAGRGKTGVLFTLRKSSIVPECLYGIERDKKKGKKPSPARQIGIRIRKKSALAGYLVDRGTELIKGTDIGDDRVAPDLALLGDFEPFTLVPLVTGKFLSGILVIGNHAKRPKQDREGLLLLARIFSIHLYTCVLERTLQKTIEDYANTNRELTRLISLYDFAGFRGVELHDVLKSIGETFGIEAAVLTGGWNSRGPVYVYAGFGFSEKGLMRYRVLKTDSDIKALIKSGAPGVITDTGKLMQKLPEEDRKKAEFVAAVPVVFDEETLGMLFVHGMAGVRTRLNSQSAVVLKNIAQTLVPFLLYARMAELEPYEVLERLLTQEAQKARKKKALLHIVAFKIKNYRAIIKQNGFRNYRNLLHRFSTLIKKGVERGDIVRTVALNKIVLLLIRKDQKEVGEAMKRVKSATRELLDKKKAGVALSYSPLRTSYPNESRSIPEILQLIE